jgi:hypothetical protein
MTVLCAAKALGQRQQFEIAAAPASSSSSAGFVGLTCLGAFLGWGSREVKRAGVSGQPGVRSLQISDLLAWTVSLIVIAKVLLSV